jgi:Short C-terminal domain
MVRRMLRTVGRTALIAGTAAHVSGRVAQRQKKQSQSHGRRTEAGGNDIIARLERLAELRSSGALTEKEFKAAKAKFLS